MKQECCRTCAHHHAILIRIESEGTEDEFPVFEHFCDGKRIQDSLVKDFRCGKYEERAI